MLGCALGPTRLAAIQIRTSSAKVGFTHSQKVLHRVRTECVCLVIVQEHIHSVDRLHCNHDGVAVYAAYRAWLPGVATIDPCGLQIIFAVLWGTVY